MNINEWAQEIHKNAVEHGWWDEPRSFAEIVALCHSELSEALEEDRAARPMIYGCCGHCVYDDVCDKAVTEKGCKPEGVAIEMIDCIIRILDWCGKMGIDIEAMLAVKHEYNKSRPYKHGKKY